MHFAALLQLARKKDAAMKIDCAEGYIMVRDLKKYLKLMRKATDAKRPLVDEFPSNIEDFKATYPVLYAQAYPGLDKTKSQNRKLHLTVD